MAVLASAEELAPIGALKTELGIPGSDRGFDAALAGYRGAALQWIESKTRRSPIRGELVAQRFLPSGHVPMVECPAYDLDLTAATPITYWTAERPTREDPDGTITLADLGRRFRSDAALSLFVYPPAAGWPKFMGNARVAEITFARAWDLTASEQAALRGIVILWARGMFTREERHFEAAQRLIRPLSWF